MRRKGSPFTFSGRIVGRDVGIRSVDCQLCLYVLCMYCSCIYVICGVHIYLNVLYVCVHVCDMKGPGICTCCLVHFM